MRRIWIKAILHRTALLGAIWGVLTAPGAEGLALGLLAVPATVWLSLRLMPAHHPVALWRLSLHLPRFLAGSVTGGIDVARRAFARDMPLNPGWVELPVDLPDGGRVALGGELSLMPGTLAAGSHGTGFCASSGHRGGVRPHHAARGGRYRRHPRARARGGRHDALADARRAGRAGQPRRRALAGLAGPARPTG
jgi:multicomponent Na+:H+ antiporter subunit E